MWVEGIVAEERARMERWARAWKAYWGDAKDPLQVKAGQANDNVKVNYARLIVDKNVAFLFGSEPVFELGAEDEELPAEVWLKDFWRANKKMLFLQKVAMNGAVCGHSFIKIQPAQPGQRFPRLVNLSPEYVNVVTDPDDIDSVLRYVIQYPAMGPDGERLVIRQTIEPAGAVWSIRDEISRNGGRWQERQTVVWQWPWAPIIDTQNLPSPNEYYGVADLEEDVLDLNDAINFVLSNIQRIVRFHAHPKTWGSGFNASELNVAVDQTIVLPNADAKLQNLEMVNDLSSSIAHYRQLKEALHETSGVPEVATGKLDSAGALSGVALHILYQPLIDRTEAKRLTFGELLVELNRRVLEMGGFGKDNYTSIHWPELLPKNVLEERQAAIIDKQLGVSQDTIQRRLGYDPDKEREKLAMEGMTVADQVLTAFDQGMA